MNSLVIDCSTNAVTLEPLSEEEVAQLEADVEDAEERASRGLPLHDAGVTATLNAVLGVWPLADAANAVNLPEQALIDEATAWLVAAGE